MTVDEAFVLAARLDLGECDSREELFVKLHERHRGVIADLIALSERPPKGVSPARLFELREARRAEVALVEDALTELGELETDRSGMTPGEAGSQRVALAQGEGAPETRAESPSRTAYVPPSGSPSSGEAARG